MYLTIIIRTLVLFVIKKTIIIIKSKYFLKINNNVPLPIPGYGGNFSWVGN
jgi:hypothetical protein